MIFHTVLLPGYNLAGNFQRGNLVFRPTTSVGWLSYGETLKHKHRSTLVNRHKKLASALVNYLTSLLGLLPQCQSI